MRSFAAAPIGGEEAQALFAPLAEANGLVVAVSGGPDSTAMAGLLARWLAGDRRPRAVVATVDHGLRPESRAEAEAVAAFCRDIGLPHRLLTWQGAKPHTRLQEVARRARYGLLLDLARMTGADRLLTAHTLDDQAETILMRLAAGSGIAGLAGMAAQTRRDGVVHVRPFLAVPKARLVVTCRANGWCFAEDPSNADPRFGRARLRRLLPLLAAEGLTAERLAALGRRAARTEAALRFKAEAALATACNGPWQGADAAHLFAEPFEIMLRALALFIDTAHGRHALPARRWRLERLETLAEALASAQAAGAPATRTFAGLLVSLRRGRLTAVPQPPRRRRIEENS